MASYLLEFLGFDLHLLLQGRVGAPELHGLLISEHHLLLHFPLTACLGRGGARGLRAAARAGAGSLCYRGPGGLAVATAARREEGCPMAYVHRFHPSLGEGSLTFFSAPVAMLLSGTAHGEGDPGPDHRCMPEVSTTSIGGCPTGFPAASPSLHDSYS